MKKAGEEFENFFDIIKRLRAPGGCPWDIEQTPFTMRTPLLEEVYEAVDAIEEKSDVNCSHVMEELGDVILNAVMIAYMYQQDEKFSVAQLFENISKKLIRRHPHVFGETDGFEGKDSTAKASTPEAVLLQWEKIKETVEKREKNTSILDDIPKSFPPMLKALKIQKKVSKIGFDWETAENILTKLDEETAEFKEAVNSGIKSRIEDELGDIFFVLTNIARHLEINPELAMQSTNRKFEKRFRYVEKEMKKKHLKLCKENLDKMEEFWNNAKQEV